MSATYNRLTIKEKIQETASTVSLIFEIIEDLKSDYLFKAGQHVNIEKEINGDKVRRSYSISSIPEKEDLKITIKRVSAGRMSSFLVDEIKEGDELLVSTPEGHFTMDWQSHLLRQHFFVTAGSGITPVISLIKDGLEKEPKSKFILLYGSRSPEDIIFRSELEKLQERYEGQFFLTHTLSKAHSTGKRLFSMFKKKPTGELWTGEVGRISLDKLRLIILEHPISTTDSHFFLCGPGDMIMTVNKWLSDQDVDKHHIHKEYFTNPDDGSGVDIAKMSATLTAKNLHGNEVVVNIKAGKTLLEALQDDNQDPPYSCINGVCSSCMAKLVSGEVKMDSCLALDDDELESGFILPCQSYPVTTEVEITYED